MIIIQEKNMQGRKVQNEINYVTRKGIEKVMKLVRNH